MPGHLPGQKSRMRMEIVLNHVMGMSFNWPMSCNGADIIRKCVSIRVVQRRVDIFQITFN